MFICANLAWGCFFGVCTKLRNHGKESVEVVRAPGLWSSLYGWGGAGGKVVPRSVEQVRGRLLSGVDRLPSDERETHFASRMFGLLVLWTLGI